MTRKKAKKLAEIEKRLDELNKKLTDCLNRIKTRGGRARTASATV